MSEENAKIEEIVDEGEVVELDLPEKKNLAVKLQI